MSAKDDQMQQGKSAANCSPAIGSAFRWQLFNENQRVELPDKSVARVVAATCNCPACGQRGLPRRGAEFDGEWRCDSCQLVWVPDRHYLVIGIPRSDGLHGSAFTAAWRDLAGKIYAIGKASGFYDHAHTDPGFSHGEKIALMHSELSEALEGLRAAPFPGKPDDKLKHRPMVEAELADTIIRIMNYASHCGLDVAGAVVEKAAFNATRGHRHGGKRF